MSWYECEMSSTHGGIYRWMEDEISIFWIFLNFLTSNSKKLVVLNLNG
jgi:hypothetical protein